jgi:hypothetical protein
MQSVVFDLTKALIKGDSICPVLHQMKLPQLVVHAPNSTPVIVQVRVIT